MPDLLDTSVWFALAHPGHPFHARALRYWEEEADWELAFTWGTALGLVRLLTHPRATGGEALTALEAWRVLEGFWARPGVSVHPEPPGIEGFLGRYAKAFSLKGGHWTDAYLAAFAAAGGYRLVSFDRDFQKYPGLSLLFL